MSTADWIYVTVADSGYRKPVRASAVVSYGKLPSGNTFIDLAGRTIEVRESEEDIARRLGDASDELRKTAENC